MLKITIPKQELWNEATEKFVYTKETTLQLEHSLVSISKWEAKWHKPYLTQDPKYKKTIEEAVDYVRCMTLTQNVDPEIYKYLTEENIEEITKYINDPATATWFSDNGPKKVNRAVITSEVLYYDMIQLGIPVEFQKWHINRLLTLIRVCSEKQEPPKKMPKAQMLQRNAQLNAARRAAAHSRG